ncbi:hypothetical protein C8J56DRAFT_1060778 [Mycena floridula]|nr:hypothetical protein C8J56DRAFT_1060778 [Mycena floridula]
MPSEVVSGMIFRLNISFERLERIMLRNNPRLFVEQRLSWWNHALMEPAFHALKKIVILVGEATNPLDLTSLHSLEHLTISVQFNVFDQGDQLDRVLGYLPPSLKVLEVWICVEGAGPGLGDGFECTCGQSHITVCSCITGRYGPGGWQTILGSACTIGRLAVCWDRLGQRLANEQHFPSLSKLRIYPLPIEGGKNLSYCEVFDLWSLLWDSFGNWGLETKVLWAKDEFDSRFLWMNRLNGMKTITLDLHLQEDY